MVNNSIAITLNNASGIYYAGQIISGGLIILYLLKSSSSVFFYYFNFRHSRVKSRRSCQESSW